MIVRPKPGILRLFLITRGSVVPRIAPQVLGIMVLSSVVTVGARLRPGFFPTLNAVPFPVLGLALSIFLGFRNNAAYDRWWEARRQWGQLVVEARALAHLTAALLGGEDPEDEARRRRVTGRGIAFAAALAAQLRRHPVELEAWLGPEELAPLRTSRNPADAILRAQTAEIASWQRAGRIDTTLFQTLEARLAALAGIQAACERLAGTPLPFAYTLLVHRTAYLFCLLLPFGLVAGLGLATPLIAGITAYTFFGLDALGDELEQPFGPSENAVPLDALVRTVEIGLLEAAGEADLPEPLAPVDYVLR